MAKTILLAEDSPDDVLLFNRILQKSGLRNRVMAVCDGIEVIAYLKGQGDFSDRERHPFPGILMLDLKMSPVDGFEVLDWISSQPQLKDLLIVVLSHSGNTSDINRAYALGAHSFLTKPFTHTDLLNLATHFRDYWGEIPAHSA